MTQPMILLEQVSKRFGSHQVLSDMTFQVNRGEIVGLLGPNGSGKTTTVRLMGGVISSDGGRMAVAGYDPAHDGDAIRRASGTLTETAGFYPHLSGLENLRFFARLYGVTDPDRPRQLLAQFGLAAHQDRKAGTYSTGMRKRLGLARALLHRPELLFLDEPTNGLDPEGIQQVLETIVQLNRREGITMMICTHQLEQMQAVCHRYVFVGEGRVLAAGTMAELSGRFLSDVVLEVETDLRLDGDAYRGVPARRSAPDRIAFTLPDRGAVPGLLQQLTQDAAVYGAAQANHNLQTLYFKVKEGANHE